MGYRAPRMSKDCRRVGALKRRVAPLVTDAQTCANGEGSQREIARASAARGVMEWQYRRLW